MVVCFAVGSSLAEGHLIMTVRRILVLTASLWLGLLLAPKGHADEPARTARTPLDDYIAKPDPSYSWKLLKTIPSDGYTTFVVDMTSQTWRAAPEVDRPVWQHWVVIVKPDTVKHETAFLNIGGGKNDSQPPNGPDGSSVRFARETGTVVAELKMI